MSRVIAYRTAFELYEELVQLGVPRDKIGLADMTYLLPSKDWLIGTAGPAFAQWVSKLAGPYVEQRFDCDDFSLFAATFMRILHRDSTKEKSGIAFGIVWEAGIAHAYCIARHEDGWAAYEPQEKFEPRRLPQWPSVAWIYM